VVLPSTGNWLAGCCNAFAARFGLDHITCAAQMLSVASMALLGRRAYGPHGEHITPAFGCICIAGDASIGALRACRERLLRPLKRHQEQLDERLRQPSIEARHRALVLDSRRRRLTAIASGSRKDDELTPEQAEEALLDCLAAIDQLREIRLPQLLLTGSCDERQIAGLLGPNEGRLGIILDAPPALHPLLAAGLRGGPHDIQAPGRTTVEHLEDIQIAYDVCCDRSIWNDHLA